MPKPARIVVVTPIESGFVKSDSALLASAFRVRSIVQPWPSKHLLPLNFMVQFFRLLFAVPRSRAIVVQFAGYHSVLPVVFSRLFRIPALLILHGTEAASLPELRYGNLRGGWLRRATVFSLRRAAHLLPVSASLIATENTYSGGPQGVKVHLPDCRIPFTVVSNGLDIDFWSPSADGDRNPLRCCAVFASRQFTLKGGDLLVELAHRMPQLEIAVAGATPPSGDLPANIRFLGRCDREALRELYRSSSIHFQLSRYEGFGLALCEAMLCGCIPIVSSVNILPEIAGSSGYVLTAPSIDELVALVNRALNDHPHEVRRKNARNAIIDRYSLKQRRDALIAALENAVNGTA